ncbi:uncharacterized protein LOC118505690 [Anopheles stephensi]|uniref:uncharacterized protein LOC118505690 n=1 Tax=Anopheles stephensi TaxID=30069 RepID=UPI0016589ADC|nr:uncharacterized protein LOC118505690 [Anopheles stephensi]
MGYPFRRWEDSVTDCWCIVDAQRIAYHHRTYTMKRRAVRRYTRKQHAPIRVSTTVAQRPKAAPVCRGAAEKNRPAVNACTCFSQGKRRMRELCLCACSGVVFKLWGSKCPCYTQLLSFFIMFFVHRSMQRFTG